MTSQFAIIKGEPVPAPYCKYPFPQMDVGDCFEVPRTGTRDSNGKDLIASRVMSAAKGWAKRCAPTRRFSTRIVGDVVRCWRVA